MQKKLSIPGTVSRVLKYIPELQKQVEKLVQKREELLSKINNSSQQGTLQVKQEINCHQMKSTSQAISLSSFSASQLNDKEIALQISSYNLDKNPLSEILHNLEEDGFLLLNASSFESFGGRIFHNLHLQVHTIFFLLNSLSSHFFLYCSFVICIIVLWTNFFTSHVYYIQVDESYSVEYCGSLGEKIMSLCDNNKEVFL